MHDKNRNHLAGLPTARWIRSLEATQRVDTYRISTSLIRVNSDKNTTRSKHRKGRREIERSETRGRWHRCRTIRWQHHPVLGKGFEWHYQRYPLFPEFKRSSLEQLLTLRPCSRTFQQQHIIWVIISNLCNILQTEKGNIMKYTTFCRGINWDCAGSLKNIMKNIYVY
jgi:hypothetical protein